MLSGEEERKHTVIPILKKNYIYINCLMFLTNGMLTAIHDFLIGSG